MANQPKKYTKFVATAATATLVASAIVPVASAASFSDVAETNSHAENINALVEAGIIKGFEDGTFKPGQELTRGQVVKMLGKWVEAQGVEIPADFATKARFTDVAVDAKDQELVKYAALVADAKVFNGSNGVLNASGKISRENMALVLDRAYTAIKATSLVELASTIEDVKVADLATAKTEAQEAIQALRDLGITVVENFNPKASVTRGQFASFLNKTINTESVVELTVKTAVAIDANTVEVVLSDDTKHTIKLEKALEANKATEITFSIGEKEYTATVTFVVTDLTVTSVEALDAGTIQVKFNTEVKASSVLNATTGIVDQAFELVKDVTSGDTVSLATAQAELLEDGKTLNIYVGTKLEGNYKLNIAKDQVVTKDSKMALATVEAKFNIVDKTRASIVNVKNASKYVFEINVSEPVVSTGTITAKLADGTSVISGTPTITNNGKTIVVTLVNNNRQVEAGKDITVVIPALTDLANNVSVPLTQTVKVSNADLTEPTLVSATALSNTKIELSFDEVVATVDTAKIKFNGQNVADAQIKATDKTKVIVTLGSAQTTAAYLTLAADAVTDLSGNKSLATSKLVTFVEDKVAPTIVSNSVQKIAGADFLVVKFSEAVEAQSISSLVFKYTDKFGVEQSLTKAITTGDVAAVAGSKETEYAIALAGVAFEEGTAYSVELAKGSFKDLFANELAKTNVNFTFNPADTAATRKLVATVSGQGVDDKGRYLTVDFDKTVEKASAESVANYAIEGAVVTAVKLTSNDTAGAQVRVYLQEGTVEATGTYEVTVQNVKGFSSTIAAMDKKVERIAITENVAATVKEKSLVFGTTDTVATLTFTEAVTVGSAADFDLYVDGKKVDMASVAAVAVAGDNTKLTVTITGKNLSEDIAAGKSVVLKATESFDIVDLNTNYASTVDVVLN